MDREAVRPGTPLVMTMHRAKGLELTHVLLFGVAEGAVPRSLKDYDTRRASRPAFAPARTSGAFFLSAAKGVVRCLSHQNRPPRAARYWAYVRLAGASSLCTSSQPRLRTGSW